MKNTILFSIFILIAACGDNKNASSTTAAADTLVTAPSIVGNDADAHGCKASAGYSYSEIRKDCIRIFETGLKLSAANKNVDSTMAAFIVFISDKNATGATDSLELFIPNQQPVIILKETASKSNAWKNENYTVNAETAGFNIQNNKGEVLYRQ
jgi:hypothetical protein